MLPDLRQTGHAANEQRSSLGGPMRPEAVTAGREDGTCSCMKRGEAGESAKKGQPTRVKLWGALGRDCAEDPF